MRRISVRQSAGLRRAVVAALALVAASAAAIPPPPPPPPLAVLTVSSDFEAQGYAEAYLALIDHRGAFKREATEVSQGSIHGCTLGGQDTIACIRAVLKAQAKGEPTAVVLVRKAEGARQDWTCIGVGDKPFIAERQSVELDLEAGFFGKTGPKFEQYKLASGCVTAAAAESGW